MLGLLTFLIVASVLLFVGGLLGYRKLPHLSKVKLHRIHKTVARFLRQPLSLFSSREHYNTSREEIVSFEAIPDKVVVDSRSGGSGTVQFPVHVSPVSPDAVFSHQQLDLLQYFANAYPHVEGSVLAGVLQNVNWNVGQAHSFLASALGPPVSVSEHEDLGSPTIRREDVFSQLARRFPECDASAVWAVLESLHFDQEAAMMRLKEMQ